MSDYITTYKKIHFTPLEPREEDICIEDIAHALSLMTRANGHFPEFYSVAQHSIHCCEEAIARGYAPEVVLACLLHDASEAYVADITRPVKKNLSEYLEVEKVLQGCIVNKFIKKELNSQQWDLVYRIDDGLLYHEFLHYMEEALFEKPPFLMKVPEFCVRNFTEVEEIFLFYFHKFFKETNKVLEEAEAEAEVEAEVGAKAGAEAGAKTEIKGGAYDHKTS